MNISSEPLAGWTDVPERLVLGPLWMPGAPRRMWVRPYVGMRGAVVLVVCAHPSGLSFASEPGPDDHLPDARSVTWYFDAPDGERYCGSAWGVDYLASMHAVEETAQRVLGNERAP